MKYGVARVILGFTAGTVMADRGLYGLLTVAAIIIIVHVALDGSLVRITRKEEP